MATTKISSNVLADGAALANLNSGASIAFTKNVSVSGNTTVTGNLTVNTNTLFIDSVNNRIGVRTLTPNETLTISGSISATNTSYFTDTWANGQIILGSSGNGGRLRFARGSDGGLQGTIGYGTATSGALLTISNQGGGAGVVISTQLGENTRFTSTGNVGIGVTAPSEKLSVLGSISASGGLSANNVVYNDDNTLRYTTVLAQSAYNALSATGYNAQTLYIIR